MELLEKLIGITFIVLFVITFISMSKYVHKFIYNQNRLHERFPATKSNPSLGVLSGQKRQRSKEFKKIMKLFIALFISMIAVIILAIIDR